MVVVKLEIERYSEHCRCDGNEEVDCEYGDDVTTSPSMVVPTSFVIIR